MNNTPKGPPDDPRTGQHLNQDWIDWDLYKLMTRGLDKHFKKKPSDQALGVTIATVTTFLVACVTSANLQPQQKMLIMADIVEFMRKLYNEGARPPTGKPN